MKLNNSEHEFSFVTNFIDSSLMLVSVNTKGYLLNYVNDKFLQTFMDHFKNISFDETDDDETDEDNEKWCSCLRRKVDIKLDEAESQTNISERVIKLDRLFRKKIFREFDMELELFNDDRQ
jgi:hypothetical protein